MIDLFSEVCFWGIAVCSLLSLIPFRFSRGWKSWGLYLPVAGFSLFALYSCPRISSVDSPSHLSLLMPLLMFIWVNSMMKMGLLQVLLAWSGGSRRRMMSLPQRRLQLAASLPILAGCTLWFMGLAGSGGHAAKRTEAPVSALVQPRDVPGAAINVTRKNAALLSRTDVPPPS